MKITVTKRDIKGQQDRQAVLDYLNQSQGVLTAELFEHFGWKKASGGSVLFKMLDNGEVGRESVKIEVTGVYGRTQLARSFRWVALRTEAISAERMRAQANKERAADSIPPSAPKQVNLGRRYVNNDQNRPVVPCHDAMGSGGLKFGIGSSFNLAGW